MFSSLSPPVNAPSYQLDNCQDVKAISGRFGYDKNTLMLKLQVRGVENPPTRIFAEIKKFVTGRYQFIPQK
jgi:hypothetical protein